jgi:hypothetical protein
MLEGWRVEGTADDLSLRLVHAHGATLDRIAGRPPRARVGGERLARGDRQGIEDGMLLQDSADAVLERGGIPVIPWGVGKWMGRRGEAIRRILLDRNGAVLLGDNGGRPRCWSPRLFEEARRLGVAVLPGTDPLRLPWDCYRAGSYGFSLAGKLDLATPARDLVGRLGRQLGKVERRGLPVGLSHFIRCQAGLRLCREAS